MTSSLLLVFIAAGASGCASVMDTILPAYPHSADNDEDRVIVRLLNQKTYGDRIKTPVASIEEALLPPAIIGAAAGWLVDYTAKSLETEAARHEAEFGGNTNAVDLVNPASGDLNYAGFEVIRCKRGSDPTNPRNQISAKFYALFRVEFDKTADSRMLKVYPTLVHDFNAKAKVQDWRWYLPWTLPIFMNSGSKLDISATVKFRFQWFDKDKDFHNEEVALLPDASWAFKGYDLATRVNVDPANKEKDDDPVRWLPFIPKGFDPNEQLQSPRLHLEVDVTEVDTSKAAELENRAADALKNKKDDIVQKAKDHFSP